MNKAIKEFINASVELGCVASGSGNVQVHHCKGRTFKHNKVHIGEWFVLPLYVELHDVNSNHFLNITHHKNAFIEHYGQEAELWQKRLAEIELVKGSDFKYYPPIEIVIAIESLII